MCRRRPWPTPRVPERGNLTPPTSDCLLGHGLVQFVAGEGWECSVCGDVVGGGEGAAVKECSRCDYVVCSSCQGAGGGGKKRGKKGKKGRK